MYRLSSLVRTNLTGIRNKPDPFPIRFYRFSTAMADTNGTKASSVGRPAADKKAKGNDLKEVKILMLHGK